MDAALVLAGLALGAAATPHCALMCAAPCAALTRGCGRSAVGFQFGRLAGYMAGGALAAGSMAALATWSQAAPVLRPVWTVLHLGFLALGLWWLATGRPPQGLRRDGRVPVRVVSRRRQAWRACLAGLAWVAWVAWPCAALQAALLLAALANDPAGGALALAPWAWARWWAGRGRRRLRWPWRPWAIAWPVSRWCWPQAGPWGMGPGSALRPGARQVAHRGEKHALPVSSAAPWGRLPPQLIAFACKRLRADPVHPRQPKG